MMIPTSGSLIIFVARPPARAGTDGDEIRSDGRRTLQGSVYC